MALYPKCLCLALLPSKASTSQITWLTWQIELTRYDSLFSFSICNLNCIQVASVGYFETTFVTTGITTKLTAAQHAGILHYTFPETDATELDVPRAFDIDDANPTTTPSANTSTSVAHVLIDLAHALPSGGSGYIAQRYIKGSLSVAEDGLGYHGSAWYDLGWNQGEAWQICGYQHPS
jgi:putative alpha-1,2-mannosidase